MSEMDEMNETNENGEERIFREFNFPHERLDVLPEDALGDYWEALGVTMGQRDRETPLITTANLPKGAWTHLSRVYARLKVVGHFGIAAIQMLQDFLKFSNAEGRRAISDFYAVRSMGYKKLYRGERPPEYYIPEEEQEEGVFK